MYLPKHFHVADQDSLFKLISNYPFATVISYPSDAPSFINHFPLIREDDKLIGHMSRHNPQWMQFEKNPECTLVFHGPHAYISPSWYRSGRDVPTWNYAVAHLQGTIEVIHDFKSQVKIIKAMSDVFENSFENPWRFSLPDDLKNEAALTAAIVSFRFTIKSSEAKFKLSQNRGEADREGVRVGLQARGDENSLAIAELMTR